MVKFNQNAWVNPYIDMRTELTRKTKSDFGKYFFKFMNNAFFLEKIWIMLENIDISNLSQQGRRRNYLVSEPNYHTTKLFTEHLSAIEIKRNADTYEQTCLFRTFNNRIK